MQTSIHERPKRRGNAARATGRGPGAQLHQLPDRAAHLAEILKALAHPLRLRIVALLCQEREHVNQLAARLGAPQTMISQQLRILRMRGLVIAERSNGYVYYRLGEPTLAELLRCIEGCA